MLAFWVFAKDFLVFARDKQTFLLLIAMPLILIAILGFALSGLVKDSSEEIVDTVANFKIGVVDEDRSEQSTRFVEEILIEQLATMLTVSKLEEHQVDDAFKSDQISVALYIPAGFGQAFEQHTSPTVNIVTYGDTSIEQSVIAIALQHYQNINLAVDFIIERLTATYMAQAQQQSEAFDISSMDTAFATLSEKSNSLVQAKTEQNVRMGSQTVGSFQYYAVGMGVMYLLITVTALVGNMLSEKEEPVYLRQFVSRLTAQQYLIGKYLSLILITFLQLTITVVGTSLLFNVDWGASVLSIIFTMFTLTLSTSALGLFIASFINKASTFNNMSMIGTQILSALGGSFVPIYLFPDWMVAVTKVLPNALGLQMFLDIMTGATFADIWQLGAVALAVSLLLFILAWIRLGRKGGAVHV